MTTEEMQPLLDHPDPQVRKLAEEYGTLWDASHDLIFELETEDQARPDTYERLAKLITSQPN